MKTGKNSPPLRHIEAEDKFQIDINYVTMSNIANTENMKQLQDSFYLTPPTPH